MKGRRRAPGWDKLSRYGQDNLLQLAFAGEEMLAELGFGYHFPH